MDQETTREQQPYLHSAFHINRFMTNTFVRRRHINHSSGCVTVIIQREHKH